MIHLLPFAFYLAKIKNLKVFLSLRKAHTSLNDHYNFAKILFTHEKV